ncbi:uncharacterized protein Dyak_GE29198, isoform A [Drosophila yakuba]|uniref:Uncharacterized protein, isoform A n=1 Tax=Drosophila yakuba TaxID=7245 RepID=A0A0R1EFL9_DROYA|nr:uncharacterized protein Dyak_GE29198, isoform A [Drosophila yakuba]
MRSDQEIHTIDPHVSPNSTQRPKYKQYATHLYPNRKSVRPSDANGRSKCRKRDDDQIEKSSSREGGPDLFVLEWGSSDPTFCESVIGA